MFDFDKSQPAWASSYGTKNTYQLPVRDFVKDLEGAFGSKLTEVTMYF